MKSSDSEDLERAHGIMEYIVDYCQEHLSENALVKSRERCKTIAPETNHLQEAQDEFVEDEEHEEEEELSDHSFTPSTPNSDYIIDAHVQGIEWHTKNDKFVYDASLSSNGSYYVETDDNLSAEALCLVTHLENINNDELEIESCSTNVQGLEEHITN